MAFFLLCLTMFIMFFQPVAVFPHLQKIQPLRNAAIIALLVYGVSNEKSKTPFFSVKTNKYFFFFAVMQILGSCKLWMNAGIETFNLWLRMGLVYFLIFKSVINAKRLKWIVLMIVCGITYLSYYSLSNHVVDYIDGDRASGFGWYSNGNDLSMILVSVIPLLLMLVNVLRKTLVKDLFLAIAVMFSFNILFTLSRSGLLGLCVVGLLCLIFSKKISKPLRLVLTVLLFISVITVGVSNVLNRGDLSGLTGDASSEDRKIQWKAGIRMALANPIFGVGRGEFRYRAVEYGGVKGLQPHNTIIQVFGDSGILGGIFYLLFGIFPLISGWKIMKKSNYETLSSEEFIMYRFLIIALSGFWVCAFFSNRYHAYILYILVGLITALRKNIIDKKLLLENDIAKINNKAC